MIISCEQCATRYHLDSQLVRPSGTKVRCSKCHFIFVAFPSVETAADVPDSDAPGMEDLDLDNFEDDPIDKIDTDLKTGGFLSETPDETMETSSESVDWQSEEGEIPDLADELDKILGPDDSDDASIFDDTSGDIDIEDEVAEDTVDPELAELSDDLEDLFAEDRTDDDLIDAEHPAIQEVKTEDLISTNHDDIEVLDLSLLDDDDDLVSSYEDDESTEDDASLEEMPHADDAFTSEDDFSLEALERALDQVEANDFDDATLEKLSRADEALESEDEFSLEALEKALEQIETTDPVKLEKDDLVSLDEGDKSAEDVASLDVASLEKMFDADDAFPSEDEISMEALDKSPDQEEASDVVKLEEDDLISLDEDDASTEDDSFLEEPAASDETGSPDGEFSMEAIEEALDRAEATEDALDFDLSDGSDPEQDLEDEVDPAVLAAETDPDLDVSSLLDIDDDSEKVGTDTIAMDSLTDENEDGSSVSEETPGLDTVQIEDFEFDLENLDEIAPDTEISDQKSDSEDGLLDADSLSSNDEEDQAVDALALDSDELTEMPLALDDQREADSVEVEGEFKSVSEDMESVDLNLGTNDDADFPEAEGESSNDEEDQAVDALALDLDEVNEMPEASLDDQKETALDDVEGEFKSVSEDIESVDLDLDSNGQVDLAGAEGEEPSIEDILDDEDEDFSLDTNQIESFHEELEGLQELDVNDTEPLAEENVGDGEDFSFDTEMIEAVDGELDNLEALISAEDEMSPEEISVDDAGEDAEPSTSPAALLAQEGETVEEESLDPEQSFTLDTLQIESFDNDIENLDEVSPTGSAVSEQDDDNVDLDDDFDLNLDDIEGLDLEIADSGDRELGGDDFVLDASAVDALDLEPIDDQLLAGADENGTESTDDDLDLILDEEQIESLDFELESTDMPEGQKKEGAEGPSDKGPAVAGKKTADVLNLDLERPDLDGSDDSDDGVDLPVLDDLLAPAEVIDETLVDEDFDLKTDKSAEEKSDTFDGDFSFDDNLDLEEGASEEADLPVLDLDDIDRKDESGDGGKKAAGQVSEPDMALVDEHEADALPVSEEPFADLSAPADEDRDQGPKTLGELKDTQEPMPSGRFEPGPKKKTNKLLLALLVIVLLLGLLFGLNSMGVKIPGVDQLNITSLLPGVGQPVDELGNSQIKTADIKGKFVSNKNSGRIFVVTGQVLNQYNTRRGDIQVKGTIYATGGKQVASQNVLSGNMISDGDLKTKPIEDIKKHLSVGQNTGPIVDPGKTSPFMIVFAGLPADIEEFSVEVVRSNEK